MRTLSDKSIELLRLAALNKTSVEWQAGYDSACARFSEKAVVVKFEELCSRGYMECGVSARTGWLTDKGREALSGHDHAQTQ